MALRDILVKFIVDVDQTPLKEADENVTKLLNNLRKLADAAGVTAVALGAKKLFGFIEDTVEAANMVDVFAKRLDVTTQQVQEFQAIAGVTGLQMNFFQHAFRTLNFQVAQSKPEFAELARAAGGVKFNFKDTGELFWQVGEALGSVTDKTRRAYLAQTLLGRSAQQLMPIFSGTKEEIEAFRKKIQEVSEVFSQRFIEKAKGTWLQTNIMGLMWKKVAGLLTEQLLPAFNATITKLQDLAKWTQGWIEDGSAMNEMIAAAIVVTLALTNAFGGFILEVTAAAAPWAALYLAIDDVVTFLNGGDSLTGDFLGSLGIDADLVKKSFQDMEAVIKLVFAEIGSDDSSEEFEMKWLKATAHITEAFNKLFSGMSKRIANILSDVLEGIKIAFDRWIQGVFDKIAANPVAQKVLGLQGVKLGEGVQEREAAANGNSPKELREWQAHIERLYGATDASGHLQVQPLPAGTPVARLAATMGGVPSLAPGGSASSSTIHADDNRTQTVHVTVQGNADAGTARQVAGAVSTSVAGLGRDRSAVGAALGIPQ